MSAQHKRSLPKPKPFLWQRHGQVVKEKAVRSRAIYWIFGFLGVILIVLSGYLYRMLTSGVWIDQQRLTLVVGREGESLAVVSVPPKGPVLVLYLDPRVMVDTIHGYGEYKVGSLMQLGKIEKLGTSLMTGSLQQTLALKIHDVVLQSVPDQSKLDLVFLKSLVRPMALSVIGHPLSITDVYRYFKTLAQLRSDQIMVVPVHESRLSYTKTLPDDSVVYILDKERLDGYLQNQMKEHFLGEEEYGMAIVNTTPHSGLAASLSRILLNNGMDVVSVGENQDHLTQSKIIVANQADLTSQSVLFLSSLLQLSPEVGELSDYRARVVIMLGEDYFSYLSQKP